MTKQDVLDQFNVAVSQVVLAAKDLKEVDSELDNPDGLIMTLTDRLLQANEMEKADNRVVGASAVPVSPLRGLN
jgi:hypothetical protein